MDLTDFDEVTRAIREENWNMGVDLDNLYTSVSDFSDKNSGTYWTDCMRERVEKSALEILYLIKKNKWDNVSDKAIALWREYEAVPEENRDAKSDAYGAYKEADDEASDLNAECEEIKAYINSQRYFNFME